MKLILLLYILLLGVVCVNGVYQGIKHKELGYNGRRITRDESPGLFHIGMVIFSIGILTVLVTIVVLIRYSVTN